MRWDCCGRGRRSRRRLRKCPLSSIQHGVTHEEGKALHLLAPTLPLTLCANIVRERGLRREGAQQTD